jgi:hypothetical protein
VVNPRRTGTGKTLLGQPEAEAIALNALRFLVSDEDRSQRFLAATGLSPGELRLRAGELAFLGGVLDYLLADEALVLAFAGEENLSPERPAAARALLPGATPW